MTNPSSLSSSDSFYSSLFTGLAWLLLTKIYVCSSSGFASFMALVNAEF